MGSLSNESFEAFIESLKQAGVAITHEAELRERLAEARRWRDAFRTLACTGQLIGIRFEDRGASSTALRSTLARFEFPEGTEALIAASMKAH